ncbi:hypothetical protein [Dyella acidiphila]|uniref:DUF4253 domain-containing protein n=1 Tax=Dyella acidiphila TaxID=2775866 RepID=A0ABR9GG16_9GAMM|nr:hypothetical protein [Dyella acidiphila]MBE1162993.1 hypothetical protein [Dyella acidiphila]
MQRTVIDYREKTGFRPVDTFSHLRLKDLESMQALLALLGELNDDQPEYRFLCTLDDLGQCCYTSNHALEQTALCISADKTDFDNPSSVREFELRRLSHVMSQLQNPDLVLTWEGVVGELIATDEDIQTLIATNRHPSSMLDRVVYVQRLPVPRDDLLIAGIPNGYFSSDWNVFQNHVVIQHMQEQYGYRFFGIGASWLGFVRPSSLEMAEAEHLMDDLAGLYGCTDNKSQGQWKELEKVLLATRTLFLCYTENFGR